jgi:hypothetical protein
MFNQPSTAKSTAKEFTKMVAKIHLNRHKSGTIDWSIEDSAPRQPNWFPTDIEARYWLERRYFLDHHY